MVKINRSVQRVFLGASVTALGFFFLSSCGSGLDSSFFTSVPPQVSASATATPIPTATPNLNKFAVAEYTNNRVLIWNTMPTTTHQPADVVVGQADFSQSSSNNGGISASTLNEPFGISGGGGKLYVSDAHNNRILIWNSIPTTNGKAADLVLGQTDFVTGTANTGGISASSLNSGSYVFYQPSTHFTFAADNGNNRVLIWTTPIVSNHQAANLVLGQSDFVSAGANAGGLSASSLSTPNSVYTDGKHLFVGDSGNHRILIWNSIPTSNKQAADVEIGQPDMVSGTLLAAGAKTFQNISSMLVFGSKLFVSNEGWVRVTVFNSIPTTNNQAADFVIGQPDFTTTTANTGGVGANTFGGPQGLATDGVSLYIVDNDNSRILGWKSVPSSTQPAADFVLGQPDMISDSINAGGSPAANTLREPGIAVSLSP